MKRKNKTRIAKYRDAEIRFAQYLPMARTFAERFAKAYNIPQDQAWEDARSVLGLCVAEWNTNGPRGYDKSKSNPTSWIFRRLRWDLLTLYTRKQDKLVRFSDLESTTDNREMVFEPIGKTSWIDNFMLELGDDAKAIVQTVLFAPAEIVSEIRASFASVNTSTQALVHYLVKQEGWDDDRIEKAWEEIQACLAA